jgi:hypothetical protein
MDLQVRDWYVESFRELKSAPPIKDMTDEDKFTKLLEKIFQRHAHVVPTMARSALTHRLSLSGNMIAPNPARRQYKFTELRNMACHRKFMDLPSVAVTTPGRAVSVESHTSVLFLRSRQLVVLAVPSFS